MSKNYISSIYTSRKDHPVLTAADGAKDLVGDKDLS